MLVAADFEHGNCSRLKKCDTASKIHAKQSDGKVITQPNNCFLKKKRLIAVNNYVNTRHLSPNY